MIADNAANRDVEELGQSGERILAVRFGTGALQFELVEGWQKRPEGLPLEDLSAVATDSEQNVYLYGRAEHPITVYDRHGNFIRSWGEGRFSKRSHGIFITPKDELYLVDDGINFVGRFSLDGELQQIIGPAGIRSDTGYRDGTAPASRTAGPYNSPTNVWVAGPGDIYVRTAIAMPPSTGSTGRASWSAPGATASGRGRASSGCRMGSASAPTEKSTSPTARTTACRFSAPRAFSSRSGSTSSARRRSRSMPPASSTWPNSAGSPVKPRRVSARSPAICRHG